MTTILDGATDSVTTFSVNVSFIDLSHFRIRFLDPPVSFKLSPHSRIYYFLSILFFSFLFGHVCTKIVFLALPWILKSSPISPVTLRVKVCVILGYGVICRYKAKQSCLVRPLPSKYFVRYRSWSEVQALLALLRTWSVCAEFHLLQGVFSIVCSYKKLEFPKDLSSLCEIMMGSHHLELVHYLWSCVGLLVISTFLRVFIIVITSSSLFALPESLP